MKTAMTTMLMHHVDDNDDDKPWLWQQRWQWWWKQWQVWWWQLTTMLTKMMAKMMTSSPSCFLPLPSMPLNILPMKTMGLVDKDDEIDDMGALQHICQFLPLFVLGPSLMWRWNDVLSTEEKSFCQKRESDYSNQARNQINSTRRYFGPGELSHLSEVRSDEIWNQDLFTIKSALKSLNDRKGFRPGEVLDPWTMKGIGQTHRLREVLDPWTKRGVGPAKRPCCLRTTALLLVIGHNKASTGHWACLDEDDDRIWWWFSGHFLGQRCSFRGKDQISEGSF